MAILYMAYSHLFSKLEEVLINNKIIMNLLRQNFMITENVEIDFIDFIIVSMCVSWHDISVVFVKAKNYSCSYIQYSST